MLARSLPSQVAVALATIDDLPANSRSRPDAERRVSRIAARRAIRRLAGDDVTIEIRRRSERAPTARVRNAESDVVSVAIALTHRDGRAAAIAAPAGTRIGIDFERLDAVRPEHQRYFLSADERRAALGTHGTTLWALKEAAWKALQLDGSVGFKGLDLAMNSTAELTAVSCDGRRYDAVSAVSVPWAGYVMVAVVLEEVA